MKLTPSQIETIERFLLNQDIRNLAFYNEILDHFITTLEQKLGEGKEFHRSFNDLTYEFNDFVFKRNFLVDDVRGLKGMEMKYESKKNRSLKQVFLNPIKNAFNKKVSLMYWVIVCLAVFLSYLYSTSHGLKLLGFLSFGLYFPGLIYYFFNNRRKLSAELKLSYELDIITLKAKQLENKDDAYFLLLFSLILMPCFNLGTSFLKGNLPHLVETVLVFIYFSLQLAVSISFLIHNFNKAKS